MTRTELWTAYVTKNPAFAGPGNVTLSAAGLKKLFDQTWDRAEENGKALGVNSQSLYERIFGKDEKP